MHVLDNDQLFDIYLDAHRALGCDPEEVHIPFDGAFHRAWKEAGDATRLFGMQVVISDELDDDVLASFRAGDKRKDAWLISDHLTL